MLLLGLKFISNNFMMRTLDLIKRIKYYQSKDNKLLDIPDSVCIAYKMSGKLKFYGNYL